MSPIKRNKKMTYDIEWTNEMCLEDVLDSKITVGSKFVFVLTKCGLTEQEKQILALDMAREILRQYRLPNSLNFTEKAELNVLMQKCLTSTVNYLQLNCTREKLDFYISLIIPIREHYRDIHHHCWNQFNNMSGKELRENWHVIDNRKHACRIITLCNCFIDLCDARKAESVIMSFVHDMWGENALTILKNFINIDESSHQNQLLLK